jgi:hypothetical protein
MEQTTFAQIRLHWTAFLNKKTDGVFAEGLRNYLQIDSVLYKLRNSNTKRTDYTLTAEFNDFYKINVKPKKGVKHFLCTP